MSTIIVRRNPTMLEPNCERVILRPFMPARKIQIKAILNRALAMTELDVEQALMSLRAEFDFRHFDIEKLLFHHFEIVRRYIVSKSELSQSQKLLIGALFSGEYSLESSALFNPSIVPHPDQRGVPRGGLRFIMSLRATGEGHISSIEFRMGTIGGDGSMDFDPASRYVTLPEVLPNPMYHKARFSTKLNEMGFANDWAGAVLDSVGDEFTRDDLVQSVVRVRSNNHPAPAGFKRTLECIRWLADSNYELRFSADLALSERIIFPVSTNESNGIEDARFVMFTDNDGTITYYATYTAYNGRDILPQLIETRDFLHFRVLTLNGNAVQNKGMALFPRRIDGRYVMLSRQDDENLFIMHSDSPHHWNNPQLLMRPLEIWESVKIGNCGSPIETNAGWLVITHGVGPMRKYCIGAALLDLHDPTKVIGRLREPLLSPEGNERDGYVPNVVYSCGSLVHGKDLILPYAISDTATAVARIRVDELLACIDS